MAVNNKLRKEVLWFADRMEKKLKANDGKGGWKECAHDYLVRRMEREFEEMIDSAKELGAQVFFREYGGDLPIEELIDECADIANFAMMIADKAKSELKSGDENE